MILNVTEQNGITLVEFVDVTRFTLSIADEVKQQLRPLLNNKECKMVFDLHGIDFIDSSGIGCIIALFKTAKSIGSYFEIMQSYPRGIRDFQITALASNLRYYRNQRNLFTIDVNKKSRVKTRFSCYCILH